MSKPVVVFDLDGTLVDSAADLARAVNAMLAELHQPPHPLEKIRSFVGHGAEQLVQRAVQHIDVDTDDYGALLKHLVVRFKHHYERDLIGETKPFPGIPAALDALRDRAILAVATNKPGVFARPLVDALLPGTFACVVGPDDAGALKPDKAVLAHVSALTYGTIACFVGDSAVDVETGRAWGVPTVGVTWGLRPEEAAAADVVVAEVGALAPAILRLLS